MTVFRKCISGFKFGVIFRGIHVSFQGCNCWWFRNPARKPPGMVLKPCIMMGYLPYLTGFSRRKPLVAINRMTSWWFQPILKISVKLDHLPQIGVKIKNIGNHHLVTISNWWNFAGVRRLPSTEWPSLQFPLPWVRPFGMSAKSRLKPRSTSATSGGAKRDEWDT